MNRRFCKRRTPRAIIDSTKTMHPREFAPALLAALVLLTHFSMGSFTIFSVLSYADVMCCGGIIATVLCLSLSRFIRFAQNAQKIVATLAFVSCTAFLLSRITDVPWHEIILLISSAGTGAFVALTSAFWFECYADKSIEQVAICLVCSLVIGVVLSWFLVGMAQDRFTAGYAAILLLAGISLCSTLRKKRLEQ